MLRAKSRWFCRNLHADLLWAHTGARYEGFGKGTAVRHGKGRRLGVKSYDEKRGGS